MVDVRKELIDRLRRELVGPNAEKEVLAERPSQRYLTGILWPYGTAVEADDDEDMGTGAEGEETGSLERVAPLSQAMKPSSMGLSFVVAGDCTELAVTATWGAYVQTQDEPERWQRTPVTVTWQLDLVPNGERCNKPAQGDPQIHIEWLARPLQGNIAVSLFLVNRKVAPKKGLKDPFSLFQPMLTVRGSNGGQPFRVRALAEEGGYHQSLDQDADNLLYRQQTVFAVGHGTAVDWSEVSAANDRAGCLTTSTLPDYQVPQVIPPDWDGGGSLKMDDLADPSLDGAQTVDLLWPLVNEYQGWLNQRELELDQVPSAQLGAARDHLLNGNKSLGRMQKGLDLLETDPDALRAFKFANRAMARQRRQTLWARQARESGDWSTGPDLKTRAEWRPFQIAFILQALKSVAQPGSDDRGITDLLWFPTGGGKTEAYLGLAAFTMALRRLRGVQDGMRGDAGVTVIMRYTLRLLTVQQFQRASVLICACEVLRKEDVKTWGTVPFRIGLWVGQGSTPNTFEECVDALSNAAPNQKSTPIQLVNCPWCGTVLSSKDDKTLHRKSYSTQKAERRLLIGCLNPRCDFHRSKSPEGIPAVVVDEEVYRLAPTLLIGTVDKFARLPWMGETQALFGRVKGEIAGWGFVCEGDSPGTVKNRNSVLTALKKPATLVDNKPLLPPELIIQDELHLIGGPLGTMVGLYESAIDQLCARNVVENGESRLVGPKVIASTATIRRAREQVGLLFNRELAIFPSPGLDAGDSFFAVQQPTTELPGRVYLGLSAPGRSVKTALVRVYAALLAATGAMKATPGDLDPYQTLVGYFNSLRELGGAIRLLEDDVRARMGVLQNRTLGQLYPYQERDLQDKVPELTSRVDSQDIPDILARLERRFPAYTGKSKDRPVDAVLASNMISVGVDVSRLGLMVVTGQPKTTAEYIQATSRVGREFPGLIVTVYNWARPRDLSHYERFRGYHAALYRYVEAISVTPFSARARDRALAAVLVTLCRLKGQSLAPGDAAVKFKASAAEIQRLKAGLIARVQKLEAPDRVVEVTDQLQAFIDRWDEATGKGALAYTGGNARLPRVLYPLGGKENGLFPAPNSMRDVEPSIGIYLREEES